MENRDWLSRFMEGKKKYSASIILPIIIAILNMLAVSGMVSGEQAKTLESIISEFLPTLVALFGGIVYTIVEGINDNTRAKNQGSNQVINGFIPQPTETPQISPLVKQESSNSAQVTPFDKEAFMQVVEQRVNKDYGIRNACTIFYEAKRVLREFWKFDNQQAWKDAQNFLYALAEKAFKEVWGQSYDDAIINLNDNANCTYPNIEYKAMQKGIEYYAILLELKAVKETLSR